MTHSYKISNMTCGGCLTTVKSQLLKHPYILSADLSLPDKAAITMEKHISSAELQEAIGKDSKYRIEEDKHDASHESMKNESVKASWISTYKPLIIIFAFITGIALISSWNSVIAGEIFMRNFMAGFFIAFSFFKFLDIKGFADSYSTYDLLAIKIRAYGFAYPFIELLLGIAYLTGFNLFYTNIATIAVMGFSSIGVIQSVMNKRKIQCACLGTVFNLPMSTVTIIEDLLMVAMAGIMII
ncbi:MAG: heavy-metal-associated domain-containing protein [Chitinophagales bacterium]